MAIPLPVAFMVTEQDTVLEPIRLALQQANITVITAAHTAPILQAPETPVLMILDYSVPRDFAPRDFAPLYHRYPVPVLAVLPDTNLLPKALDEGATDYVTLPLEPRILARRLQSLLLNDHPQHTVALAEERYRSLAQLMFHHIYTLKINPDRTLTRDWRSDDTIRQITGYTYDELDTAGGWSQRVHPEDRHIAQQHIENAVAGQPAISDYRFITRSGEVKWLREHSSPIVDNKTGKVSRINGAVQDITHQKLAEIAAAEQHRLIEAMHSIALTLSSTLDFERVLDHILTNVEVVVPYDTADILLVENGMTRVVRYRSQPEIPDNLDVLDVRMMISQVESFRIMAQTGEPFRINDVGTFPGWIEVPEILDWVRAYLGAPLFVGERLVGFLNLNSATPNRYTEDHVERLQLFASQVSIAISNAQLYDTVLRHSVELEQRIRDLIVVYEIGQALTSMLDVTHVCRLLYQEVVQQIFVDASMRVFMVDDASGALHCVFASTAEGEISAAQLTQQQPGDAVEILKTRVSRMTPQEIYEPLISRDRVIGVLSIRHGKPALFDEVDGTLLSTLANQAAVALENAQLYATINQQMTELSTLYSATTNLIIADSLEELGRQITRAVVDQFDQIDCGLLLVNPDTHIIEQVARAGSYEIRVARQLHVDAPGLITEAIRTGTMVYASDTDHDTRYLLGDARTRSELVLPLHTRRGLIGVLDLQSPERDAFDVSEQRVLKAFAERAAAAIENMQLYEEVRSHAANLEQRVQERTAELRKALEKERELSEMKSRFVKTVSHEFRTPLTVILTASEMLKRYSERMSDEERTRRFAKIEQSVNDMERMLEATLTLERATDGVLEFHRAVVDIHDLSKKIIDEFSHNAGRSHRIEYVEKGDYHHGFIDVPLWRKILNELLFNAVKYSDPGSRVLCELTCTTTHLALRVQDTGLGISQGDHAHLFEMFYRGDNVEHVPGSGLGLTIVREAVALHSGSVQIESEIGTGTTVSVQLPNYPVEMIEHGG